ncbi:hypothetical protein [Euhalothece natronophila]|nr:hypothetical protein [Euhalothece natronophila]
MLTYRLTEHGSETDRDRASVTKPHRAHNKYKLEGLILQSLNFSI